VRDKAGVIIHVFGRQPDCSTNPPFVNTYDVQAFEQVNQDSCSTSELNSSSQPQQNHLLAANG
jgi:hypothetical protein